LVVCVCDFTLTIFGKSGSVRYCFLLESGIFSNLRHMETEILHLNSTSPDLSRLDLVSEKLSTGGLVVFPTETVYGIGCVVRPEPIHRLNEIKSRVQTKHYTVHIANNDETGHYVPRIDMRAKKLIRQAWPGPLTIIFELVPSDRAFVEARFDEFTVKTLYKDNTIGLRCPDNVVANYLLKHTAVPVVAPSANLAGQGPAKSGAEAFETLGGRVDVIVDGGVCKYGNSSTVVKIDAEGINVLREGAYSHKDVQRLSTVQFLFICTGNSCRSPMAEGMFRKYLAEKIGCDIDRLEIIGYKVSSGGTMGITGVPVSRESVKACRDRGVDISSHSSRALSKELIEESDLIFGMTSSHRRAVVEICPEADQKCLLLDDGNDIGDPIGQSQQVYDRCAEQIEKAVQNRISELII